MNQLRATRTGIPKARPRVIMYAGRAAIHLPRRSVEPGPGRRFRERTMKTESLCPRGILLAAVALLVVSGCVRVPPHLLLPDLRLGEPSFFPTLEAYAGSPIVPGNRVEFLLNGEEIFPAVIEAIQG